MPKKAEEKKMMAGNKRRKGTGSVFERVAKNGTKFVGVLPPSLRPPHQETFDSPEEAHAWLDAHVAGLARHTIYLPKTLGEEATAKATENDTTLSRVVEGKLEEYVAGDGETEQGP